MKNIIWFVIMIPCSALFTGIGIYAMKRKKPMWFWSGSTVHEEEISNIPTYNRANGLMWITYSLVFWAGTFAGIWSSVAGGIIVFLGCLGGIPFLVITYNRIYRKYKR